MIEQKKLDFLLKVIQTEDLGHFLDEMIRLTEQANKCKYLSNSESFDRPIRCRKCGSFHVLRNKN